MRNSTRAAINAMAAENKRRKAASRALCALGVFVMLFTYGVLTLPAATLEGGGATAFACGLGEHAHKAECYEPAPICGYGDALLPPSATPTSSPGLGAPNALGQGELGQGGAVPALICLLEETPGHAHAAECYGEDEGLACLLEESQGHAHAEGCYAPLGNTPFASLEAPLGTPICGLDSVPGHVHAMSCFAQAPGQVPPAPPEEHAHTADCFELSLTCLLAEHAHAEGCAAPAPAPTPSPRPLSAPAPRADVLYSSELEHFVNSVIIKDTNGNPISTTSDGSPIVEPGETYHIALEFAEIAGERQFQYDGTGVLTYRLPEAIVVTETQSGFITGDMVGEVRVNIGTYVINIDGTVEVRFYDMEKDGTPTPGANFITNYENAYFSLELTAKLGAVENNQTIVFGDNASVTITVESDAGLELEKESLGFNTETKTIDHMIKITGVGGPIKNLKLVDTLFGGGLNYAEDPQNLTIIPQMSISLNGETPVVVTPVYGSPEPGAYNIDFSAIDGFGPGFVLNDGDIIVITYSVRVGDLLPDPPYSTYVNNRAQASGTDEMGNNIRETVTVWTQVREGAFVEKTGGFDELTSDIGYWREYEGTEVIYWTIIIGDGTTDLRGATITDTLGPGLKFFDKNTGVTDLSNIAVEYQFAEQDGKLDNWRFLGWAQVINGGNSFTYVVPTEVNYRDDSQLSHDTGPVLYLRIRCYCTFTEQTDGGVYTNSVTVETANPNKTETGEGTVSGVVITPIGVGVEKTSKLAGDSIEYKITYSIPKELYGISLWLEDSLSAIFPDGSSRPVRNLPFDMAVTANGAAFNDYSYVDSGKDSGFASAQGLSSWRIYFPTDGSAWSDKANSLSPFSDDTKLVATYKIPLSAPLLTPDAKSVDYSLNMTLGDVMRLYEGGKGGVAHNVARMMSFRKGTDDTLATDWDKISWPVHKTGAHNETDKTFDYVVLMDLSNMSALASGGQIVFTDTFDSRLTYVYASFTVTEKGPTGTRASTIEDGRITIVQNADTTTLSVQLSDSDFAFTNANCVYEIRYSLKLIDPDAMPEFEVKLNNTAGITLGGDSFTSDHSVSYGEKVVTKDMKSSGSTAAVEIIINAGGFKLADGNTYDAIDTMSDTLALSLGSLKAYTKDEMDIWRVERPLTLNGSGAWSYRLQDDGVIVFTLPDETPVLIKYNALIKGKTGQDVSISNIITIAGEWSDSVGYQYRVVNSGGAGGGNSNALSIYKYDSEASEKGLAGAKFAIYADYAYTGYLSATPPDGVEATINIGGATYYYLAHVVTGNDGMVSFANKALVDSHAYAAVEISAPVGYITPSGDERVTLFYYEPMDNPPDNAKQIADIIRVSNTPWGAEYPNTGGIGRTAFAMGGLSLMITAVAGLMATRAKARNRKAAPQ